MRRNSRVARCAAGDAENIIKIHPQYIITDQQYKKA